MKNLSRFIILALCVSIFVSASLAKDKMSTREIIDKSLASVGTPEAIANVKTILASGSVDAVFKGRNAGATSGKAVFASEGDKYVVGFRFPNNDYPYEKMGYDGEEFTVGFLAPGIRSPLGEFMLANKETFKYGLLSGSFSTAWELKNYDQKFGKLKCGKPKKFKKDSNQKAYKCGYNLKSAELNVNLFFDEKTFRHIRTEYRRVVSSAIGSEIDNSSSQQESRYRLTEDYDDFKTYEGLTLPTSYLLDLHIETATGTTAMEWRVKIDGMRFNDTIDAAQFKVDTF